MVEAHESLLRRMLGYSDESKPLPEKLTAMYADYKRLRDRVDLSPVTPIEMGCLVIMSGSVGAAKDSPLDLSVNHINTAPGDMVIVASGPRKGPSIVKKQTATGFEVETSNGLFDIPLANLRRQK